MKKKNSQPAWRRYTIAALILALLACISTALLGAAKGVIALGLYTLQSPEKLNNALWISGGLVILGIALYVFLEPARFQRFITGRQARYGGNTLIASLAFIGILIIANVLAFRNPTRLADMTEDQSNTLAKETLAALETLPEKVHATAFFSQNSNRTSAEQLLGNIKAASKGKFDYEFVNPDAEPQRAFKEGITGDGKILLVMGDRRDIAASGTETEILQTLIRLINPDQRTVYFLTGHGERDIEQANSKNTSMVRAKDTLTSKNYVVKTLNLFAENKIPEDASAIVIAGPTKPVSENEVKLLKEYLASGGSLLVMEDPTPVTNLGAGNDPLAEMLAKEWGITIDNDVVIDLNTPDPTTAAAAFYDTSHPVTRNTNNLVAFFPFTRSLTVAASESSDIQLTSLVQTNERSWGETNFDSLNGGQVGFDSASDKAGPLTLAAAGENSATKGRVIVFGTSNLAVDQIFDSYGNGDIFINSVDWAAQQENLANITPKQPISRTFQPASQLRILLLILVVVILVPGIFVVLGIMTWFQRRRQG